MMGHKESIWELLSLTAATNEREGTKHFPKLDLPGSEWSGRGHPSCLLPRHCQLPSLSILEEKAMGSKSRRNVLQVAKGGALSDCGINERSPAVLRI